MFMRFEEMIAHIRSGGHAKRAGWQWANIGWSKHSGPTRGDMDSPRGRSTDYRSVFLTEDYNADDWIKCTTSGAPVTEGGTPIVGTSNG